MEKVRFDKALQETIWGGSLPLEIRLSPAECRTYDQSDPYLVRLSSWEPYLYVDNA